VPAWVSCPSDWFLSCSCEALPLLFSNSQLPYKYKMSPFECVSCAAVTVTPAVDSCPRFFHPLPRFRQMWGRAGQVCSGSLLLPECCVLSPGEEQAALFCCCGCSSQNNCLGQQPALRILGAGWASCPGSDAFASHPFLCFKTPCQSFTSGSLQSFCCKETSRALHCAPRCSVSYF